MRRDGSRFVGRTGPNDHLHRNQGGFCGLRLCRGNRMRQGRWIAPVTALHRLTAGGQPRGAAFGNGRRRWPDELNRFLPDPILQGTRRPKINRCCINQIRPEFNRQNPLGKAIPIAFSSPRLWLRCRRQNHIPDSATTTASMLSTRMQVASAKVNPSDACFPDRSEICKTLGSASSTVAAVVAGIGKSNINKSHYTIIDANFVICYVTFRGHRCEER